MYFSPIQKSEEYQGYDHAGRGLAVTNPYHSYSNSLQGRLDRHADPDFELRRNFDNLPQTFNNSSWGQGYSGYRSPQGNGFGYGNQGYGNRWNPGYGHQPHHVRPYEAVDQALRSRQLASDNGLRRSRAERAPELRNSLRRLGYEREVDSVFRRY